MKNVRVMPFSNTNSTNLANDINEFLAKLKGEVLDIKFSQCEVTYDALVIYENEKGV